MYRENTYYNTYQELINYIEDFNKNNQIEISIDTIRINFSKQHKLNDLQKIGNWKKLNKSDENIKRKLNKRLDIDEVASAYQLENYNIYYYNSNKDKPRYRNATLVIFGMKQYHKAPPPHHIVKFLVNMLTYKNSKNDCNIDLCFDMKDKPNIDNLKKYFNLRQYIKPDTNKPTDTYYINDTGILMINKICIYNKALKNELQGILYRIEATISIPNLKVLQMPLNEFKQIIEIAKGEI